MIHQTNFSVWVLIVTALAISVLIAALTFNHESAAQEPVGTPDQTAGGSDTSDDDTTQVSDEEETSGGWKITVGETEFTGRTDKDVGQSLFDGKLQIQRVTDDDGVTRTVKFCTGFPEIEVETNIDTADPIGTEISLKLDAADCNLSIGAITSHRVNELEPDGGSEPVGPLEKSSGAGNYIAYRSPAFVSSLEPPVLTHMSDTVITYIPAHVIAELQAADGEGFALTQSEIEMSYDVSTLNVLKHSEKCEAHSPAGFVGVVWHNDACRPGGYKIVPEDASTSYLRAYIEGDYHAETNGPQKANRSSEHSSSATIKGYSDRYVGICRWWPDEIEDLKIGFPDVKIGRLEMALGVSLECVVHGAEDED